MKKLSVIIAAVLFSFGVSKAVVVQGDNETASHDIKISVPSLAILDIEGGEGINLSVNISELEAGERVDFESTSNNQSWLNYSVISAGSARQIYASMSTSNLPSGISLLLEVGEDVDGVGSVGEVTSDEFTLQSTLQPIISGIGSSYTKDGEGHGHNLTYKLKMADGDLSKLVAGENYDATIVYTFTEIN